MHSSFCRSATVLFDARELRTWSDQSRTRLNSARSAVARRRSRRTAPEPPVLAWRAARYDPKATDPTAKPLHTRPFTRPSRAEHITTHQRDRLTTAPAHLTNCQEQRMPAVTLAVFSSSRTASPPERERARKALVVKPTTSTPILLAPSR